MSYRHLFSFFLFYFLLYVLQFIESLLKFRWYFISISIVCLSINPDSWDVAIIYGIFIVTETLSLNLSCVFPLTQILEMLLLYGIIIVTDRLQPSHLSIFFFTYKFSIVLSLQIDQYGLQCDSFLSVFLFFWSWLKFVYQTPIKWVQEIDNDSRACRWNWSRWEVNISSLGPKGIDWKWILLFVLFFFFFFILISLLEKKCCSIMNEIEFSWSQNY